MKTLDVINPKTLAEVLTVAFLKLSPDRRALELINAYEKAVRCSKADDSDLCAKLNAEELEEYSELVAIFLRLLTQFESFRSLQADDVLESPESVPFIANIMAWQQVLSRFRNLHD